MPTQEQFYEACHQFLPKGRIWPAASESANVNTLVENTAFAAKEIDDDASAEFDDVFPDSVSPGGFIEDWERVLGLPKSLVTFTPFIAGINVAGDPLGTTATSTPTPSTDQERVDLVLAMLNNDPLNNAQFYIDLGAIFGMTVTVLTGTIALDWSITVVADPGGKLDLFTVMCNFFKPAHTRLTII